MKNTPLAKLCALCLIALLQACASQNMRSSQPLVAVEPSTAKAKSNGQYRLVVSVHDQSMALLKNDEAIVRYQISTAKNGVGEAIDSGRTPRGKHAIAEKIGAGVAVGTVFEDRIPINEVVAANTPDRTPVATRILRLRGLEDKNQTSFERLIYLHGSPAEKFLGTAVSGGCIRMRSDQIVVLFDLLEVGTEMIIFEEPMEAALRLLAESDRRIAKLEETAKLGLPVSARLLCVGSVYGINDIAMNDQSAIRWCSSSVLANDAVANTMLGELREKGRGYDADLVAARRFYERGAKLGNAQAQFRLGQMYESGLGGDRNENLASEYVSLAAKQGHPEAKKMLAARNDSKTLK